MKVKEVLGMILFKLLKLFLESSIGHWFLHHMAGLLQEVHPIMRLKNVKTFAEPYTNLMFAKICKGPFFHPMQITILKVIKSVNFFYKAHFISPQKMKNSEFLLFIWFLHSFLQFS